MDRAKRTLSIMLIVLLVITAINTVPAVAFLDSGLGSILKLFGIGYVVSQFGPEINDAINTITFQKDLDIKQHTKVVPIISGELSGGSRGSGIGGYIGAAQVSGPQDLVEQVEAVAQIEADWQKALRLKVLIPVDNINPLEMKRISGVGVSALLDVSL